MAQEKEINETPWMSWLEDNIGQKEVPGKDGNNPFITEMFNYTSLKGHPLALLDETAWCAACANAALVKNGFEGTNSAAASSFETCGQQISKLKYGAIVVLKRANNRRHVTFFVEYADDEHMTCLGGNQHNALDKSLYKIADMVAIRWPTPIKTKSGMRQS